jgi:hypothetical protein
MSRPRFRPGIDLPAEQVEANRRYWETEESVNAMAEAMGMSKGRLYDLLLPFDAGAPCPACGMALGHPHRTARDRGDVACEGCGFEGNLDALPEGLSGDAEGPPRPTASDPDAQAGAPAHWTPGAGGGEGPSQRTVVGVALLGVAAGIVLAGWLRRR